MSPPQQIDEDLTLLSHYTDCVRTYSIDNGQDQVAAIAQRHGMKVLQGDPVSSNTRKATVGRSPRSSRSPRNIPTSSAPSSSATKCCCAAICRSPISRPSSARSRRRCRSRSPMPTFGNIGCATATCKIPSISSPSISCRIGRIFRCRRRWRPPMSTTFAGRSPLAIPNKEIVVGEFGWPSEGRMREGALPSPSNQARAIERDRGAGAAREFPPQRHRGFRPALETPARGRDRRLLGDFRPRHGGAEIQFRRQRVRSSALARCKRSRESCLPR